MSANPNLKLNVLNDSGNQIFFVNQTTGINATLISTYSNTTTSTNSSSGSFVLSGGLSVANTSNSSSYTAGGSVTVAGGVAVEKDTFVGGTIYTPRISSGSIATPGLTVGTVHVTTITAGTVQISGNTSMGNNLAVTGLVQFNSTAVSTNSSTASTVLQGGLSINRNTNATSYTQGGALTVVGGASVAQDAYIGGTIYTPRVSSGSIATPGITAGILYVTSITGGSIQVSGDVTIGGSLTVLGSTTVLNVTTANQVETNVTSSNIFLLGNLIAGHNSHTLGSLVTTGGNVGIGTTSPGATLDVSGTARFTTSVTTAALYSTNQTTTNIVGTNISGGGLRLTSNFISSSTITIPNTTNTYSGTSGAVGLSGDLVMAGSEIMFTTTGVNQPTLNGRSNGTKIVLYPSTNTTIGDYSLGIENRNMWLQVATPQDGFKFYQGTAANVVIATEGNLGINTTNPISKLHVIGFNDIISVESLNTGDRSTIKFITNGNDWELGARGSTGNPDNVFYLYNNGTSKYVMAVSSTGNIGLGDNTNPGATLDVNGTARFTTSVTTGVLYSTNQTTTNGVFTNLSAGTTSLTTLTAANVYSSIGTFSNLVGVNLSSSNLITTVATIPNSILSNITSNTIVVTGGVLSATFNSNTIGSLFTTGGNVGINTTSPTAKLEVVGSVLTNHSSGIQQSSHIGPVIVDRSYTLSSGNYSGYGAYGLYKASSTQIALTCPLNENGAEVCLGYYADNSTFTKAFHMDRFGDLFVNTNQITFSRFGHITANGNISSSNLYSTNQTSTNAVFTNLSTGTLSATNTTVTNLVGVNLSSSNLIATVATIPNIIHTNITSTSMMVTGGGLLATFNSNTIGNIFTTGGNIGISTTAPNASLHINTSNTFGQIYVSNAIQNRKIVLWNTINNDHQFFGFGINDGILRYQINNTPDSHVFYAGTNATTSNELFRITGTGNISVANTANIPTISAGNILTTNASISSLNVTNNTLSNIVSTNITSTNINSTNVTSTNLVSTNTTLTNLIVSSETVTNLSATNISSGNISAANLYTSLGTITNLVGVNLSSTNLISTVGTIPNIVHTNVSTSTLVSSTVSSNVVASTTYTGGNMSLSGNLNVAGTLTVVNITATNFVDTNVSAGIVTVGTNLVGLATTNTLANIFTTSGNVGIATTAPGFRLDVNGAIRASSGILIPGTNGIEFGHGVVGKEVNAGRITYDGWSNGLAIVGSGTNSTNRRVYIFEHLEVGTSITTGTINATTLITSANITANLITSGTSRITSNLLALGNSNTIGNIFTTAGNVGIQNTSPNQRLELGVIPYSANQDGGLRIGTRNYIGLNDASYRYIDIRLKSNATSNFRGAIIGTLAGGVPTEYEYMSFADDGYMNVYAPSLFTDITSCSNSSTGSVVLQGGLSIDCPTNAVNVSNGGALTIAGGAAIAGDLIVGGSITYSNAAAASSTFAYLTLTASDWSTDVANGALVVFGGISVQTTANAFSATEGNGITIAGGAGIGRDLYVGGVGYIPRVISTNNTTTNIVVTNASSTNLYVSNSLRAQFNANTLGNLYTTGGNVGIGATTPSTNLHILNTSANGANPAGIFLDKNVARSSIQIWNYGTTSNLMIGSNMSWDNSGNSVLFTSGSGWSQVMGNASDSFSINRGTATNTSSVLLSLNSSGLLAVPSITSGALYTTNQTTTNGVFTNLSVGTLVGTTVSTANTYHALGTISNLVGTNLSSNNLVATVATIPNIIHTNITSTSILVTSGGLSATFNSNTIGNMYFTGGNVGIATTSPGATLDVSGTGRFTTSITTGIIYSTNQTTTNAVFTNLSVGTLVGTTVSTANTYHALGTISNLVGVNLSSTNLIATVSTIPNIVHTNISTSTLVASTVASNIVSSTTYTGSNMSLSGNLNVAGTLTVVNITATNLVDTNVSAGIVLSSTAFSAVGNSNTLGSLFTTSGNVGIGTTSPGAKLDVSGTARFTTSVTSAALYSTNQTTTNGVFTNLSAGTTSLTTLSAANVYSSLGTFSNLVGVNLSSSNLIATVGTIPNIIHTNITSTSMMITGGGLLATFNSNTVGNIFTTGGNIGIGTTSPQRQVHIQGVIRLDRDEDSSGFILTRTAPGDYTTIWKSFQFAVTSPTSGNGYFAIHDQGTNASGGGTRRLVINNDGNIGIANDNPETKLDVTGTARITTSLTTGILYSTNQTTTNAVFTNLSAGTMSLTTLSTANVYSSLGTFSNLVGVNLSSSNLIATVGTIPNIIHTNITSTSLMVTGGGLLATFNANTLGNIFTTNGNVGIGTTAPGNALDVVVNGDASLGFGLTNTHTGGNSRINWNMFVGFSTSGNGGQIYASTSDPTFIIRSYTANTSGISLLTGGAAPIKFVTQNTIERMRIATSGNVGIGTTAPAYTLDVVGSGDFSTFVTSGALYSTNVTSTNVVATNLSSGSINVSSLTATNVSSSTLDLSTGATTAALRVTGSSSLQNVTATNITATTLSATTGVTTGTLNATGLSSLQNITGTNISATSIIATSNISANNLNAATGVFSTGITSGIGWFTNSLTAGNLFANNFTVSSIFATTLTVGTLLMTTGITSPNIFVTNLTSTNAVITNSTTTSARVTNEVATNISTSTLNAGGLTAGNINFTGSLYQNGSLYISSQWTTFGTNLAYTTGNVGINTTSPTFNLDVNGNGRFRSTAFSTNSTSGALVMAGGVSITGTNAASNTMGGGLTVAGGVGISQDLYVGGNIYFKGIDATVITGTQTIGSNTSTGTYQASITLPRTMANTSYKIVGALKSTTNNTNVYNVSFTNVTTTGFTANIYRLDALGSGWTDTNLTLSYVVYP